MSTTPRLGNYGTSAFRGKGDRSSYLTRSASTGISESYCAPSTLLGAKGGASSAFKSKAARLSIDGAATGGSYPDTSADPYSISETVARSRGRASACFKSKGHDAAIRTAAASGASYTDPTTISGSLGQQGSRRSAAFLGPERARLWDAELRSKATAHAELYNPPGMAGARSLGASGLFSRSKSPRWTAPVTQSSSTPDYGDVVPGIALQVAKSTHRGLVRSSAPRFASAKSTTNNADYYVPGGLGEESRFGQRPSAAFKAPGRPQLLQKEASVSDALFTGPSDLASGVTRGAVASMRSTSPRFAQSTAPASRDADMLALPSTVLTPRQFFASASFKSTAPRIAPIVLSAGSAAEMHVPSSFVDEILKR